MKKVVITQEIIDAYPYKSSPNRPHRPYCHLCVEFNKRGRITYYKALEIGEQAILVKYRNGTIAHYHLSCWNDPKYARKVENIKKQSID